MNRAEHLILEYVATGKIPLSWLTATNIGELLNTPSHDLSFAELTDTVYHMFLRGDIAAMRTRKWQDIAPFVPTLEDLMPVLRGEGEYASRDNRVYYGLTAQGGAKWEALAEPDWSKYIYDAYGAEEDKAEVICMNKEWAERFFQLHRSSFYHDIFVEGTEVWDVLEPWQATYWKTLPVGHRVQFAYTSRKGSWYSTVAEKKEYDDYRKEFHTLTTWYTRLDF